MAIGISSIWKTRFTKNHRSASYLAPKHRGRTVGKKRKKETRNGASRLAGLKEELPERLRLVPNFPSSCRWSRGARKLCAILWHPLTRITDPGSVEYFVEGMEVPNAEFARQLKKRSRMKADPPRGYRVNPVYLRLRTTWSGPLHGVYHASTVPNEPWLHESLGYSIRTIFLGFLSPRSSVFLWEFFAELIGFLAASGAIHRFLPLFARASLWALHFRRHSRYR
jgi:hypothetical protein